MFTFALPTYALLKRELLVQLRRRRTFVWLLVLAVITTWILLAQWPDSNFLNWTNISGYAIIIVGTVTGAAFLGSALFVPGIAAASVVVEKEQGNWDSLYLTLISPKGIVFGKFLGSVLLYMIYMFALMPMLAVVFFLIGVDWSQFINLFVFVLATTCTLGAIGVACSVTCRKTVWAVIASYIGMTVVMGLPLIPFAILVAFNWSPWLVGFSEDILLVPSALITFFWLMRGMGTMNTGFYWHLAYQGLLAAMAVLWTLRVVRKPPKPPVVPREKPLDDAGALKKRRRSFPFYLIDPLRRAKPIPDSVNPIYAREMRCGLFLRRTSSVRLTYAFVLGLWLISVVTGLSVSSGPGFDELWALCLFGHGALICAFIPAFFANLFTKENELANLDMLLMTSLTPEEIAQGKMRAAARRVGVFLLGSLAANSVMFILAYQWGVDLWLVLTGQFTLCLCAALVLVATMWGSILSKRTAPAIIVSFVFSFLSLFGLLILFGIVAITFRTSPPQEPWIYLSPVSAYAEIMQSVSRNKETPPGWIVSMAIHCFAVYALYKGAIHRYAEKVGSKGSGNK